MSDELMVIGTSFRRVGFERLGRYVLPLDETAGLFRLREACGARELVYLATCNRVEVYLRPAAGREALRNPPQAAARVAEFFAARGAGPGAASAGHFFVLSGAEALEHLFSVAASLDSLVLGESEIAGQVRRAADLAVAAGLAGPDLRRAFARAVRAARRVHAETAIGRTPVSVASLVVRRIREFLGGAGAGAPARRAALVGVGPITQKVAAALAREGARLLFVNRTESRARELAERFGGEAASLDAFRAAPPRDLDLIVTATRAPAPVVDAALLGPSIDGPAAAPGRRVLVCDLGVPPDVDPALGAHPGVRLLRLEDLEAAAEESRARRAGEVPRARAIVAEEVRRALGEHGPAAPVEAAVGETRP